jgi:hypothetical protein
VVILELLGILGQTTQEKLDVLTYPFLHTTSHGGYPAKIRQGLTQLSTFGGRSVGHCVHCGASVGPHTAMLEYWLNAQSLSYTHAVH